MGCSTRLTLDLYLNVSAAPVANFPHKSMGWTTTTRYLEGSKWRH
ncbi:hypothetical protein J2X04_000863 [Lysobacter niabensis]|uniref:Uncharacterized protein n=1 Tax=Agrilutibacter niabensis TaxID=380628 RepID=A0ABU1VM06_9GAMM|nr:hypothetical protein [Lysobacter niabensis]